MESDEKHPFLHSMLRQQLRALNPGPDGTLWLQVKSEHDGPTIGLLLCKSKNKVVAEYALGDNTQPIGIAEYKLLESLPAELQTGLPSIEQIERELAAMSGDNQEEQD
ncbi:MAG: PDDEXK nuclease domain-containing protein [Methylococcaceae bacterium]